MIERLFPEGFRAGTFLDAAPWQWLALVVLIVVACLVAWVVTRIAHRVGRSIASRTETRADDLFLDSAIGPVTLLLTVLIVTPLALPIGLPDPILTVFLAAVKATSILAVVWFILRATNVVSALAAERFEERQQLGALAMVPLVRRTLKLLLVVLGFIAVLQNLGFNITGIVAGLGIGGLAIALAAQKTVENLFGGATLVTDQPVRVGDFCKFGDKMGTVEDVGIRSTRIRSLDRTVITIPNAEFSQAQIENFGQRDRIRLHSILGLRYETTPDQLRFVLVELRTLLLSHPRISANPARVRFVGFGSYSLDIEVFAYVQTTDWSEFLGIQEDVLLRIMDIIRRSGTGFAFPSQTAYLGRDTGVDPRLTAEAENAVRRWREAGELPFPGFTEEMASTLDDTLDWPPTGSVKVDSANDGAA